jgi:hypothetical protein
MEDEKSSKMKNRNGKPALRERKVVLYTSLCFWQGEIHTHMYTGLRLAAAHAVPQLKTSGSVPSDIT